MKTYYFIFLNIIFLISCNNSNIKKSDSANGTNLKDSAKVSINSISEKNLKRDLETYLNSIVIGDMPVTFKYTHKISMDLLRKKYPECKTTESLVILFKDQYKKGHVGEMNKSLNMKFIPGEIIGGAVHNNTKIYCIEFRRVGSNATDNVNLQANVIALSNNNGKDWKFIDYDISNKDRFISLLSQYYPMEIVVQALKSENSRIKINIPKTLTTSNKAEIKLLKDINNYFECIKNDDTDKALNYIYPDVFNYLKENSKLNSNQIKSQLINIFGESSNSKTINEFKSTIITDKFISNVKYKNNYIYVVHFCLFGKKQLDYYSFGGEYVAISTNNGKDWKFVAMSDITPSILQKKFSLSVINELFKYLYSVKSL